MTATITIEGEKMRFEREVSDGTAVKIMELAVTDGRSDDGDGRADADGPIDENAPAAVENSSEQSGLPDDFFGRLTAKQEAFVRVLLEDGDWVTNSDVRQRMEDEHDQPTNGPQGIAGVRAGFTRKYGDDFDLVERRWTGNQNEYRLADTDLEELRTGFDE